MNLLPTASAALMLFSALVQLVWLFRPGRPPEKASHWLLALSAALLATVITWRSMLIGFPALTGSYESLVFYAAFVCLICFAYRLQTRVPYSPGVQFGATIAAFALLAVANSPIAPQALLAPIPALRSGWLVAHVALSFVGESFLVCSFFASAAFLATRDEARRLRYDRIAYTAIAAGYPIFTVGALVFGAIWAENAWGSWWSWDPKETWALVTWLVYTAYLHLRLIRKRRDSLPSLLAVIGFLCALFTFFGVNYLLSGLHSYG